jgi:hypothetical protein
MVRTKKQLLAFNTMCFVRKYMHLWLDYKTGRRQQLLNYHHTYMRAVQQCTAHFACFYRTKHKHQKWLQWRATRAWYGLFVKRQQHFSGINTRIAAKRFFYRWVELYNRKLINYHLRIPNESYVRPRNHNLNHTTSSTSELHNTSSISSRDATIQLNTTAVTHTTSPGVRLQHHPAYVRQMEKRRLHNLSSCRIHINNISAISTASSVDSHQYQYVHKPKYGKLIETSGDLNGGVNTAAQLQLNQL